MKNAAIAIENNYPGCDYPASNISAFLQSDDGLFLLALKSRMVIRFYTADTPSFLGWLQEHNIRKVN